MQIIVRKGSFDSAHRVMNEKMKCFNQHGHTYHYELGFSFNTTEEIGYAIDFKEIKRIACQWIDDYLDHGAIYNPKDTDYILPCIKHNSKLWLMSLNGKDNYCNPSVENIAKELFIIIYYMFSNLPTHPNLKFNHVTLYETPNCYTLCYEADTNEISNVLSVHKENLDAYLRDKGFIEYDDRK